MLQIIAPISIGFFLDLLCWLLYRNFFHPIRVPEFILTGTIMGSMNGLFYKDSTSAVPSIFRGTITGIGVYYVLFKIYIGWTFSAINVEPISQDLVPIILIGGLAGAWWHKMVYEVARKRGNIIFSLMLGLVLGTATSFLLIPFTYSSKEISFVLISLALSAIEGGILCALTCYIFWRIDEISTNNKKPFGFLGLIITIVILAFNLFAPLHALVGER